jgi:hypothetical protein
MSGIGYAYAVKTNTYANSISLSVSQIKATSCLPDPSLMSKSGQRTIFQPSSPCHLSRTHYTVVPITR